MDINYHPYGDSKVIKTLKLLQKYIGLQTPEYGYAYLSIYFNSYRQDIVQIEHNFPPTSRFDTSSVRRKKEEEKEKALKDAKNSGDYYSLPLITSKNNTELLEISNLLNAFIVKYEKSTAYAEGGVVNDTWMVEGNIIYVWDEKDLKYSEEEEIYSQKYKRFYPISKFKTYQEVIDHEVDEFKKSNSDKVYKEENLYLTKIHKKSHDDYNDRLRDKEEREWVEEQEKYNPKRSIGSYMADGGSVKKNGYFTGELSFLNW